jgi:hypothetical protein
VRVGKHRAADACDQQRDEDRRERQHHVADTHQERIEPAAKEAREQAEHDADEDRDHDRHQPDHQRDARAVDQRREDVAALVVGAEQVLARALVDPGRRQARIAEFERCKVERVVGRDPAREHRAENADEGDQSRQHGDRRGAEAVSDIAVEPACNCFVHREESEAGPRERACGKERSGRQGLMLIHLNGM